MTNGVPPSRGGKPPVGEPLLDRAFKLLRAFGPDDRSLSLATLSRRAELPKSSALRIARKLCEFGALERLDSGEYVVGLRLLEIATLAPRGHGLRSIALPFMEDLLHATRQHVLLAVPDGEQAVLVERLSARRAGRVLYHVGGRLPLHATGVGMCLLAYSSRTVQRRVLSGDLTVAPENRRRDAADVGAQLARIRHEGVAVVSRPRPDPMTSVAAPVFGFGNRLVASLSVVAPSADANAAGLRPAVVAVCRALSRALQQGGAELPDQTRDLRADE